MHKSTTGHRGWPWLGSSPGQAPANKDRSFPAEPLTRSEVEALINACSAKAPTGLRNRALLVVLWRAGLRIGEALALKVSDIDQERGTVRVLHGKGNKARTIGMDPGAMAVVARWVDVRRAAGIRNGTLFCTLDGGRLNDRYVRPLLARLAEKAGIEKRVTPHQLRHTHSVELVAEGVPVNVIQKQLGHADLRVTTRYLDHVAPGDVIAAMQRRQWEMPS